MNAGLVSLVLDFNAMILTNAKLIHVIRRLLAQIAKDLSNAPAWLDIQATGLSAKISTIAQKSETHVIEMQPARMCQDL